MLKNLSSATDTIFASGANVLNKVAELFRTEPKPASYDMLFKDPKDGCARYDDVWGG